MTAPVLLLGFNRPDKLLLAMEPLRHARPRQVFIAVDGPRDSRLGEADKCRATQLAAEAVIDWPCEIHKLYRSQNLGCRRAVSEAIGWAFEHVEELVVIEDDCVINPSFFPFCEALLERHRHDETLMSISAANFQNGTRRGGGDYYASKYMHCWGWATWRRAWSLYEDDVGKVADVVTGPVARRLHKNKTERAFWQIIHGRCERGEVDSWAYRWLFSCWRHGGASLIPNVNMVTNIGFDDEATHTIEGESPPNYLKAGEIAGNAAPSTLAVDAEADEFTFKNSFCPPLSSAERGALLFRIRELEARMKEADIQVEECRNEAARLSRPWWRRQVKK